MPGIEPGGASLFLILSITGLLRPSIVSLGQPSRLPIIPIRHSPCDSRTFHSAVLPPI